MAAPVQLDEPMLHLRLSRAICVAHDVDRVALLVKHASADRDFRDLIYTAHLEVIWVRESKHEPELVARVDRIMGILLERFEEIKEGFDEELLASIRKMRERCASLVAEKERDGKTCNMTWCAGAPRDDKTIVCGECGDAICGDCFQETDWGIICVRCGQQYCRPCCGKLEIEPPICKECEKIAAKPAAKKKKVDPIA